MFMADWFVIAPNWKHSRCLSIGEWVCKVWYSDDGKSDKKEWAIQPQMYIDKSEMHISY